MGGRRKADVQMPKWFQIYVGPAIIPVLFLLAGLPKLAWVGSPPLTLDMAQVQAEGWPDGAWYVRLTNAKLTRQGSQTGTKGNAYTTIRYAWYPLVPADSDAFSGRIRLMLRLDEGPDWDRREWVGLLEGITLEHNEELREYWDPDHVPRFSGPAMTLRVDRRPIDSFLPHLWWALGLYAVLLPAGIYGWYWQLGEQAKKHQRQAKRKPKQSSGGDESA